MRALRIVGLGIASLVVLVIVLLIAAALFIDPNAYRGRIEHIVQQSTGRSLQLSGSAGRAAAPLRRRPPLTSPGQTA